MITDMETAHSVEETDVSISPAAAFEDLLLKAHRLASVLSDSDVFAANSIGVSEWAVLKAIGDGEVPLTHVLRSTGLSRQRIRTVLTDLESKGLATVQKPAEGDKRKRTLIATPRAADVLSAISKGLEERGGKLKRKGEKGSKRFASAARLSEKVAKAIRGKPTKKDKATEGEGKSE